MQCVISKSAAIMLSLGLGFGMAFGAMGEKCGSSTSEPVEKCGAGKCGDNRVKSKAAPGKCGTAKSDEKCNSGKAVPDQKCNSGKAAPSPKSGMGKCGNGN